MSEQVTVTVYTFDELEESVKKKVIDKAREDVDVDSEFVCDTFKEQLEELGYPIEDIRFRLSSSQGDGVAFYGRFDPEPVLRRLNIDIEPIKEHLEHSWMIRKVGSGTYYDHYNSMEIDPGDGYDDVLQSSVDVVKEDVVKTSKILEHMGYELIDAQISDESVIDFVQANEYRFLKDGRVFRQ